MPGGESGTATASDGAGTGGVSVLLSVDVGSLAVFDPKGDPNGISQRWKKWKRSFGLYLAGKGVVDDGQKRALLLHAAGVDVQEIYFTLVSEEEGATFAETMKVLDDYFIPKSKVPFERHLFRQIAQDGNETVDQFVCRLRQREASCDFGVLEDDYIRDQVIDKCYSSHLRRKFLEQEGSVTLDCLLKIARPQEAVSRQLKEMDQNSNQSHVKAVGGKKSDGAWNTREARTGDGSWNARGARNVGGTRNAGGARGGKKPKICFGCGREGHFAGDKSCPARDQACRRCGKIGHFRVRCTQGHRNGGKKSEKGNSGTGRGNNRSGRAADNEANSVGSENFSASGARQSPDFAFAVGQTGNHLSSDNGVVTLSVGEVELPDVLIDSGATCNLMGQQTWNWLKANGIQCESRRSAKVLFSYGATEPLQTLGTFSAKVVSTRSCAACQADFVVVQGDGRTLLGQETVETLGLLRVGPLQVNSVVCEHSGDDIRRRYRDLFTGIGLLKGYELRLHVDESVKPVAQPVRRIPFGLREQVDKKLDELLQADIIEEVPEGPSGWISPLVVVPKSDGDVRICVDMRRANEAIVRERHPIPTVEEFLHDLNGSTVFSKVDLKWGFHQILLSESSRHITTFVTHRGLYRYKRLMFGVTSAPEKYQQIVKDVLRGCEGVANIWGRCRRARQEAFCGAGQAKAGRVDAQW